MAGDLGGTLQYDIDHIIGHIIEGKLNVKLKLKSISPQCIDLYRVFWRLNMPVPCLLFSM